MMKLSTLSKEEAAEYLTLQRETSKNTLLKGGKTISKKAAALMGDPLLATLGSDGPERVKRKAMLTNIRENFISIM